MYIVLTRPKTQDSVAIKDSSAHPRKLNKLGTDATLEHMIQFLLLTNACV